LEAEGSTFVEDIGQASQTRVVPTDYGLGIYQLRRRHKNRR
jgi:hypothetical protein